MLDREMFVRSILGLAEALGRELSTPAIGVYYAALRELDDDAWKRAIERAATSSTKMPTPAELRALSGEHSAAERSITAWTEATTAAARIGGYQTVAFEDVAINAAIRSMGGWERFCAASSDDLERFERPRFTSAYAAFARSVPADYALPLAGRAERSCLAAGSPSPKPVLVPASTPLPGGGPRVLDAGTLPLALGPGGA